MRADAGRRASRRAGSACRRCCCGSTSRVRSSTRRRARWPRSASPHRRVCVAKHLAQRSLVREAAALERPPLHRPVVALAQVVEDDRARGPLAARSCGVAADVAGAAGDRIRSSSTLEFHRESQSGGFRSGMRHSRDWRAGDARRHPTSRRTRTARGRCASATCARSRGPIAGVRVARGRDRAAAAAAGDLGAVDAGARRPPSRASRTSRSVPSEPRPQRRVAGVRLRTSARRADSRIGGRPHRLRGRSRLRPLADALVLVDRDARSASAPRSCARDRRGSPSRSCRRSAPGTPRRSSVSGTCASSSCEGLACRRWPGSRPSADRRSTWPSRSPGIDGQARRVGEHPVAHERAHAHRP